jgi:large subunit ribosomal protein L3
VYLLHINGTQQVTQVKTEEREGYTAVQVGCGIKREKRVPGALQGHFTAAGVPLKRKVAEFRVTPDALLPVGFELRASHFVAGQYVDVSGTTIGKGFQGVMKRWGFAGQPASHGNSKAHRKAGSTGGCQVYIAFLLFVFSQTL